MTSAQLPTPPLPRPAVGVWVAEHLAGLFSGAPDGSPRFRGGQGVADEALAAFDVSGYARDRNEVWPEGRRGASALSPYIRHGLLPLPRVWDAVAGGPSRDVAKFRDELLWQEYARHLYGRLGRATARPLRYRATGEGSVEPVWPQEMACLELAVGELEEDGWVVNQARMWLASHWAVRVGARWQMGEDRFFRHLLDGSRAANRLGWQWTAGLLTGRPYGFSRSQVERRAPGLCSRCPLERRCPIEQWPPDPDLEPVEADPRLRSDHDLSATAGPATVTGPGSPDVVWITAESLGDADPALVARPELPVVFVFDEPLLHRLQLSAKRLIFLAECLADLAGRRQVEVHRGEPEAVLRSRRLAATFTPVPGWRRLASRLDVVEKHPWPWLRRPHAGPVSSFSAWRRRLDR